MTVQVINQIQTRSIDKSAPFTLTEYLALSTDIKPTDCNRGSTLEETDTGITWQFDGMSWFVDEVKSIRVAQNNSLYDASGKEYFNSVFGDRIIGKRKAKFSANFNYPTDSRVVTNTTLNGGTVSLALNLLNLSTGTASNGVARVQTLENLRYFAGREAELMATAKFTLGVANSSQRAGLFDDQDGMWIGYSGINFGVGVRKGGNDTFVAQTSFNKDKLDGNGKSGFLIDTTKLNIFRVSYGYLGIAPICFQVYGGIDRGWITFHVYDITNISTGTHINKPYLPVRSEVINNGNTTNIVLQSGSLYAGTIDGDGNAVDASSREFSYKRSASQTAGVDNLVVVIHNKATYGGTANKVEDLLLKIGIAVEGTKPVRVDLYRPAVTPTGGTWIDIDTPNSNSEYNISATVNLTGAQIRDSWALSKSDSINVDVSYLNLLLPPDGYAVFVATSTGNYDLEWNHRWRINTPFIWRQIKQTLLIA